MGVFYLMFLMDVSSKEINKENKIKECQTFTNEKN